MAEVFHMGNDEQARNGRPNPLSKTFQLAMKREGRHDPRSENNFFNLTTYNTPRKNSRQSSFFFPGSPNTSSGVNEVRDQSLWESAHTRNFTNLSLNAHKSPKQAKSSQRPLTKFSLGDNELVKIKDDQPGTRRRLTQYSSSNEYHNSQLASKPEGPKTEAHKENSPLALEPKHNVTKGSCCFCEHSQDSYFKDPIDFTSSQNGSLPQSPLRSNANKYNLSYEFVDPRLGYCNRFPNFPARERGYLPQHPESQLLGYGYEVQRSNYDRVPPRDWPDYGINYYGCHLPRNSQPRGSFTEDFRQFHERNMRNPRNTFLSETPVFRGLQENNPYDYFEHTHDQKLSQSSRNDQKADNGSPEPNFPNQEPKKCLPHDDFRLSHGELELDAVAQRKPAPFENFPAFRPPQHEYPRFGEPPPCCEHFGLPRYTTCSDRFLSVEPTRGFVHPGMANYYSNPRGPVDRFHPEYSTIPNDEYVSRKFRY